MKIEFNTPDKPSYYLGLTPAGNRIDIQLAFDGLKFNGDIDIHHDMHISFDAHIGTKCGEGWSAMMEFIKFMNFATLHDDWPVIVKKAAEMDVAITAFSDDPPDNNQMMSLVKKLAEGARLDTSYILTYEENWIMDDS